jgi:hypothetical protein
LRTYSLELVLDQEWNDMSELNRFFLAVRKACNTLTLEERFTLVGNFVETAGE